MATLANTVLAPGRISKVLEPEGIGRCLVGNGIVVAIEADVVACEIRGSIARRVVACRFAMTSRTPFAGAGYFRYLVIAVECPCKIIDISRTEVAALASHRLSRAPGCPSIGMAGDVRTGTASADGERGCVR